MHAGLVWCFHNPLNFGKGKHSFPHFYYCSVAKWILQFHSDLESLLITPAAKWFIIITVFATITFVLPSFTDVQHSIGATLNKTVAVTKNKVCEESKIINCSKNNNYSWFFWRPDGIQNHCGTVRIRDLGRAILQPQYSQKCVCGGGGGGGGGGVMISLVRFFSCYAFERINTSKMTQIERTGEKMGFILFYFFIIHVLTCTKWL